MKCLAHITLENKMRIEQTLQEHCRQTASYAAEAMAPLQLYHTGYLAGLLHDMGKATCKYNNYLEASFSGEPVKKGSVIHTFTAVIYLLEHFHFVSSNPWESMCCEILCFAIGSHHGMFDCVDQNGNSGFAHRLHKDKTELCYDEALDNYFNQVCDEQEISQLFHQATNEIQNIITKIQQLYHDLHKTFFQISLLMRMLLSSVIYGDRKDTSEFMNQIDISNVDNINWTDLLSYFESKISSLDSTSPINQTRNNISEQCFQFAKKEPGIYRLDIPTGGGKTLCSLRYGLAHAKYYNKKRIIFIIPLLSVLEQNAAVIRDFLPEGDLVLEHHSNVIKEKNDKEQLDYGELLTDNWDRPVIISTLVQLMDLLFTDRTSSIKRMQALNESIIIIDEIQSLPTKLVSLFNMAMNFLHEFCHATIILSSATQPSFDDLNWPLHFSDSPDMVSLRNSDLELFKRNTILNRVTPYGMELEECASFCSKLMQNHVSLLLICNTKGEANTIYKLLREQNTNEDLDVFHLSTAMCQNHRENVLANILESLHRLQNNFQNNISSRKLICVSTQLVEAGIDFSFDAVVRVLAGVDNLVQAAGRCNRANEYHHKGSVYFINLKNEPLQMLPEITYAQNSTRRVLANINSEEISSLTSPEYTRQFYQYYFEETKKQLDYPVTMNGTSTSLKILLSNENPFNTAKNQKEFMMCQPFQYIGKAFNVFEKETIDVLVPYGKGKDIIQEIKNTKNSLYDFFSLKDILQKAKQFTINIFQYQLTQLYDMGFIYEYFEKRIIVLDESVYDSYLGLSIPKERAVEEFII